MKKEFHQHTYVFNPYHLKDDDHGGNKLGMSAVFGEVFVVDRTSSCEFHYLQAVRNHARYINKVSRDQYMDLCIKLKDSLSQEVYNNNYYLLRELISQQVPGNRKPLEDALAWWIRCSVFVHRLIIYHCQAWLSVHRHPWWQMVERTCHWSTLLLRQMLILSDWMLQYKIGELERGRRVVAHLQKNYV